MFGRVKPLDAILATAQRKSLHRTLGAFQLTMLGIGAVIGTGIFVLTAEAGQKAGPGIMVSFVIAGFVCAVAALCYSELSAMAPVAGSAYTYTYAVLGEVLAWMVGWALVMEYALGASAVAVGWSHHVVGLLHDFAGITLPKEFVNSPIDGGFINLPAILITMLITWLLVIGTTESARVNAVLVAVKLSALALFLVLALPVMQAEKFHPFMPTGMSGVAGAAASIFFAYVGFDAVSTAAEETVNPQRNVPIGLIGSLVICTIIYMLVAAGAIGAIGIQPVFDAAGKALEPGTVELTQRCDAIVASGAVKPLTCSHEALVYVMQQLGHLQVGNLLALAATIALPSVILMMMYGQTRVAFVMARDGLFPAIFASIHPKFKTPHVITWITGVFAFAFASILPVGLLADLSNAGTLLAFAMVAIAVLVLRVREPERKRVFRTPMVWLVSPVAVAGSLYLFFSLPMITKEFFFAWAAVGLVIYFTYSRSRSHLGRGVVEVHETDPEVPPSPVPPLPGME
jgi:APA family basic amino acid/polyamine antiporter